MNARYTARKREGIPGPQIPDDEPFLVIRAQDILAIPAINWYFCQYFAIEGHDEQVLDELYDHRKAILEWQKSHPTKVADRGPARPV